MTGFGHHDVVIEHPEHRTDPRSYHWYLSIIQHVSRVAGFEMGSGMFINPSIPEETARFLREMPIAATAQGVV